MILTRKGLPFLALLICQALAAVAQNAPPPAPEAAGVEDPQPAPEDRAILAPGLRERALVLRIYARVLDGMSGEVWNSGSSKVTLPGRPVGLRVTGGNIACTVQFTPYINRSGEAVLVAQGQIWLEMPGEGLYYETIIKTIPIEFGEQVYFFPLGPAKKEEPQLEIRLEMKPYSSTPNFERRPGHHEKRRLREE